MIRTSRSLAGSVLGLAVIATTCAAQEGQSTGSKVGGTVDSAVQSLKKGAREASEAVREQYAKARASVHNMSVSARVYGRLHWDKTLQGASIDIDVHQDGVTTLTGIVPDAVARAKAVMLAHDTVGVTKVIDKLTTQTVTSTPAPADTATTGAKP